MAQTEASRIFFTAVPPGVRQQPSARLLFRLFGFVGLAILLCGAGEPVRFATPVTENHVSFPYFRAYMQALCTVAELTCELLPMPAERIVVEMAHGGLDVDFPRVAEFIEQKGVGAVYQRLALPMGMLKVVVYTLGQDPTVDSWQQLAEQHRRVGYLRGAVFVQEHLKKMEGLVEPVPVSSSEYCYTMLAAGRVDSCIGSDALLSRKSQELIASGKMRSGKVIEQRDLYVYVNKAKPDLIHSLERAQRKIHADGTAEKLEPLLHGSE
jgi:hypothetical protein